MSKPLRALLVEDSEQDAVLLVRELTRGGFDVTFERVETPEAMNAALGKRSWDIVLSDYSMPRFSGPMALDLVKQHALDLPFIIVSGTVGEDVAVEALRAGAHDYIVKGKLGRLVPAIARELRDATLRAEQKRMQEQLLISDRMASMGTLAAGLAHEINNPLASAMVNVDLAARDVLAIAEKFNLMAECSEVREGLHDAAGGGERIATRAGVPEPRGQCRPSHR